MRSFLKLNFGLFGIYAVFFFSFVGRSSIAHALSIHENVPADKRASFEGALNFLANVKYEKVSPLHEEIFGPGLNGEIYLSLVQKFFLVVYEEVEDKSLMAYAPSKNIIPMLFLTNNFSGEPVELASLLLHESKHIGAPQNGHVECPKLNHNGEDLKGSKSGVSLEGRLGCDLSWEGAYGLQAVMLRNIAKYCTSCSLAEKELAAEMALPMMMRIKSREAYLRVLQDTE